MAAADLHRWKSDDGQRQRPHQYRKPLCGGWLHSAVCDPNVEGANNGSNRQARRRRLARRPQQSWPRSAEPPPAAEAAARRQRQSTSSQWQADRNHRLARYNLSDLDRRHAGVHPVGISRCGDV